MANNDKLNQLLLRTMLLEGENNAQILGAVRTFESSKKTEEDQHKLVDTLRKEIKQTTRELMSDKQLDTFIDEVARQL